MRLYNTGLSHPRFDSAPKVVSHLGAVQAQDFVAAKWSIGLRIPNSSDTLIENAYNAGAILRTHVLRPTWHFVLPENIRWMLELTAPRIKSILSSYNRKMDLDTPVLAKTNRTIVRALEKHGYLTRQELKEVLKRTGIVTDVQRLAHIMVAAELDGLICSGPTRGKQLTYALLDQRAPNAKSLSREEALSGLARTYFTSHGPAQLKDFSWWSGLTVKDAQQALDLVRSEFCSATVKDKTYWFLPHKIPATRSSNAFLLSIFDEYTIAYKDRSDLSAERDVERMVSMGNALQSVIILNDKVGGTWKKKVHNNSVEISLHPFQPLKRSVKRLLQKQATQFESFFGVNVHLK